MQTQPGTIYFVEERDLLGFPTPNYVKIGLVKENEKGRSSDDRKDEHQTGNPREIIIEAEVKTHAQVSTLESLVHQRLAKNRIHGEWFNYGEDGVNPYVELTKEINRDLESELENDLRINNYSEIQDNGEEIKPSSDAEDIHNEFLKIFVICHENDQKMNPKVVSAHLFQCGWRKIMNTIGFLMV